MKINKKILYWSILIGFLLNLFKPIQYFLVVCHADGKAPRIIGFPLLSMEETLASSMQWYVYLFDEIINYFFWVFIAFIIVSLAYKIKNVHFIIKKLIQIPILIVSIVSILFTIYVSTLSDIIFEWKFQTDYTTNDCPKKLIFGWEDPYYEIYNIDLD